MLQFPLHATWNSRRLSRNLFSTKKEQRRIVNPKVRSDKLHPDKAFPGDAPLSVLYTNGFPDICKYIDNVNLFYSPLPVCISTSVYESLSEEDQAILKEAAQEAAKETRENNDATAEKMESDLTSQGMTIVSSEDVDTEAFQSAVQPCYDEMESYIGSEWVDQIKSLTGTEE